MKNSQKKIRPKQQKDFSKKKHKQNVGCEVSDSHSKTTIKRRNGRAAGKKFTETDKTKIKKEMKYGSPLKGHQKVPKQRNDCSAVQVTGNKDYRKASQNRLRSQKRKLKTSKNENIPSKPVMKVQTHAALYKNPEHFSSNWKKLWKVGLNRFLYYFVSLSLSLQ